MVWTGGWMGGREGGREVVVHGWMEELTDSSPAGR